MIDIRRRAISGRGYNCQHYLVTDDGTVDAMKSS
jgi:hypothetical protein